MTDFTARRTMMVDTQVRPSDVTKFPIIEALLSIPREEFVPDAQRETAYVGENLDIGGRVMLEPRTLAKMIDGLEISPSDIVLDIAPGLGYSTAVLAHLAEFVVGVEDDETRANEAQRLLSEQNIDNAAIMQGALTEGAAKSAPYDVIVVQGGVEQFPESLDAQLREGGRAACVFIEGSLGVVRIGAKINGRINWRFAFNAGAPVLAGFERKQAFAL